MTMLVRSYSLLMKMEQQRAAGLADRQVAQFIQYDQVRVDQAVCNSPLVPRLLLLLQCVDQLNRG
jgi:hypothetical protein